MAEYVCELIPDDPDVPYDSDDYSGECIRRELVVRCRDCAHWRRPSDRERGRCTGAMAFVEPNPDGFCSWGRRAVEEDS